MSNGGWSARILFILTLGLVGTLASEWWMGFVGIGLGVLGVVLQKIFVRLRTEDVVYLFVGSVAGLLIGLLILLVLRIGSITLRGADGGTDPLIMIPLALAYAMGHTALVKGRRLGLIKLRDEDAGVKKELPVLVDLSAVVDGRVADMAVAGLLNGPFVIPSHVGDRLDQMSKSRDLVERGRARRGLETLERLEESVGKTGGLSYQDLGATEEKALHRILAWLRKEKAVLLSDNQELIDAADLEGNQVIRLDEVGPATREVVLPGETITLKLVRKGRNPGQGVGFLSDGTMVVVEDSSAMVGETVDVTAHTTFRASGGTMVFGRIAPVQEEESPGRSGAGDRENDEEVG